MIREAGMLARLFNLGHVTGHTVPLAHGTFLHRHISLQRGLCLSVAGEALRVIVRHCMVCRLVRVVTREAADPPVINLEAFAVR